MFKIASIMQMIIYVLMICGGIYAKEMYIYDDRYIYNKKGWYHVTNKDAVNVVQGKLSVRFTEDAKESEITSLLTFTNCNVVTSVPSGRIYICTDTVFA